MAFQQRGRSHRVAVASPSLLIWDQYTLLLLSNDLGNMAVEAGKACDERRGGHDQQHQRAGVGQMAPVGVLAVQLRVVSCRMGLPLWGRPTRSMPCD